MHTLVIREELYEKNRWIAESLFKACEEANTWAIQQMRFSIPIVQTLAEEFLLDIPSKESNLSSIEFEDLIEVKEISFSYPNTKVLVLNNINFDTMVAEYLLHPEKNSYKLDYLSLDYLNYKMVPIEDLIGSGLHQKTMAEVPLEDISYYAVEDADVTYQLSAILKERLKKNNLSKPYNEIELPLISVLIEIEKNVLRNKSDLVIGIGGGRSVDIAKMIGFNIDKSFVSIPTSASHDGIASPFVSVKGDRPHSLVATAPLGVFVDVDIIKKAPRRLLASGCGDLIAKITAVRDWQLGRDKTGEYYGRYSADLALMSAKILMESSASFSKKGLNVREIVEALISAGVASCIAGSSRPCSGAEHLFSHAVDKLEPGVGLHGEKCGIGAIMIAKLQGQDWKKIVKTLKDVGVPTTAKEIGLKPEILTKALTIAQSLRPERYTILKEVSMTEKKAVALAKSTRVL